jgi:allophanate hydrolase
VNKADLLTLADYAAAYRDGMTAQDAVREVYRRIAAHNDPAIFITLRPIDDVLADAASLPKADAATLPLYGIPVVVKDNIDVARLPTSAACPDFAYRADSDAAAVRKLREAGALIIGKTNLDQFATGLVGVRSPYGVPRNALDPLLVPGGSSSGSAVAVAAGIVPLALGTDTAGSGRVPAGLNNIVGLKPSLGAISASGVVPACRTLDCVSVFALTVDDAWEAYGVLSGFEPADPYSREAAPPSLEPLPPVLRIGIPDAASLTFGGDSEAEAAFRASVNALRRAGHTLREVDLTPFFAAAELLYEGPWVAERYQAVRALFESRPEALLDVTRGIIGRATQVSAADAFAGQYRLAQLRREAGAIWRSIDMLVVPTFPRPHTLAALAADPLGPNRELGTYTNFVNLLDLCALAVPATLTGRRAAGITLIAPDGRDGLLASFGRELHASSGLTLGATERAVPPAPALRPNAGEDIELVVVGAHLSGMPLNGELVSAGARFARKITTAPDYRLFALPGGPPFRPGLLRVEPRAGHPIEVEVWTMPPASFGKFVASIPAPLGIGTVRLSDGTAPKGFLVENAGLVGARDISSYGGWRAFAMEVA